jgi:glycerol-3-phosphate acyltransferase PlsY
VRAIGSGNIGATNVARAGGKWLGILTLALDVSKGYFPVFFALRFGMEPSMVSFVALAAVAGHVFTPWLRFKGGKGVATALGASLAFNPLLALPSIIVFVLVLAISRFVSLGSILGTAVMPISLGIAKYGSPLIPTIWAAIAVLLIAKHRENISRLIGRTENKLWGKKKGGAANG